MNAWRPDSRDHPRTGKREALSFDRDSALRRGVVRVEDHVGERTLSSPMMTGEAMNRATQNETDARYYRDLLSPETRARLEERERARTEE